ncbi:uncharacterized protein LOC133192394 [Saccostrea echinata]|uniref:uncharacterized protein LOC133192394 n=1 Tax=Saccostrea echinata TaxID=191078 RepID=UPI002A833CDC|nr:uncharacterized protein LOC133192394 [Saccostrea echinata]
MSGGNVVQALQTLYEYIVAHINAPSKPCCIQGFISDSLEAFDGGMWWIPNMRRMKERIGYCDRLCKKYLVFVMETSAGVRRVPHLNHHTTAQSHPPYTNNRSTVKPTTTVSTTTGQASTTTKQTVQNTTLTGTRCPSCDRNLNCVWSYVCKATQSCLVRSFPGYPFSTHCAERQDCLLMKQLASSGEIYCCDDESCVHKILGV